MKNSRQDSTYRFFRDKNGNIVIAQFPNLPLIGWFICFCISRIIPFGNQHLSESFYILSLCFLFTWSYLELTQGVNYFRKCLGLGGITLVVINII